jgi:hypothetical protein
LPPQDLSHLEFQKARLFRRSLLIGFLPDSELYKDADSIYESWGSVAFMEAIRPGLVRRGINGIARALALTKRNSLGRIMDVFRYASGGIELFRINPPHTHRDVRWE